jgi:serine phosphatase RsbU (regulator of sigma subunit)
MSSISSNLPLERIAGPHKWQDSSNALWRLRRLSHPVKAAGFVGLFVVIAWLDFVIDRDLSLFALYLIPTLYAAWFLGTRAGYLTCLASAVIWLIDDWEGATYYHHAFVSYWNIGARLIVLTVIVAIVNALKGALEEEHELERRAVQREFEIASDVQARLLPARAPDCSGLDFGFFYKSAREIGGDYFDFIPFDQHRMGLAVGDVSGKGLSSALLMASLQGLVRTNLAVRQGEIAPFANEINKSLFELTAANRYATFFFALVDVSNRSLRSVNAGHNPPILFRSGPRGECTRTKLEAGGPPIGIFAGSRYRSEEMALQHGDVLVAYTDGVTEALNPQQEEFGEERLEQIVRSSLLLSGTEIANRVAGALREFVAGGPQWDDIALVVMKVTFE